MEQTQAQAQQPLNADEDRTLKESIAQDNMRALQEGTPNVNKEVQQVRPIFPEWPVSKRGPMSKQPPPGMRPVNPLRSEQMAEVGYNQETGTPGSIDRMHPVADNAMQGSPYPEELDAAPKGHKKLNQRL